MEEELLVYGKPDESGAVVKYQQTICNSEQLLKQFKANKNCQLGTVKQCLPIFHRKKLYCLEKIIKYYHSAD
mgnify:CR=1 FL=1